MQFRRCLTLTVTGLLSLCGSFPVFGQVERAELGRRLKRFETAWEQAAPDVRVESAGPMQVAVSSFFSLQWPKAGEQLDEAWYALQGPEVDPTARAIWAHRLEMRSLLDPAEAKVLELQVVPFYAPDSEIPENLAVEYRITPRQPAAEIGRSDAQTPAPVLTGQTTWKALRAGISVPMANAADPVSGVGQSHPTQGDFWVEIDVQLGSQAVRLIPAGLSLIPNAVTRIETLKKNAESQPRETRPWLRATALDYARLLQSLSEGDVLEMDYPAHSLLIHGESLVEKPGEAAESCRQLAQRDDLWLTIAEGRKRVPLRIRVPDSVGPTPPPVLMLFHGAGGSENMFFETYGAGGAVSRGLERGMLVVAPRQGLTGLTLPAEKILEALEEIFPHDKTRVLFLGHSMGAGQVATQVGLSPALPCAVAAVGGGGSPRPIGPATKIPWFIAAGSLDFGRSGAKTLAKRLENAGGLDITYREYPDVEHMVIVQAALPAIFDFFDQHLERQP